MLSTPAINLSPAEKGSVVWLTGLPATGKSTIGTHLQQELTADGTPAVLLDSGDLLRLLGPVSTSSEKERDGFYGAVGQLAEVLAGSGPVCVVASEAPKRAHRTEVRRRVNSFIEVLLVCDPTVLEQRSAKTRPEDADLERAYEDPASPEIVFDTSHADPRWIARSICDYLREVERRVSAQTPTSWPDALEA